MKYLLIIFLLISTSGISQNLVNFQFDEFFEIKMPKNNVVVDTLNYNMVISFVSDGKIFALKASENQDIKIQNKKSLLSSYKAFHKGIVKKLKGEINNEVLIETDGILIDKVNFKSVQNDTIQVIESYAFYLKNHYYNLQFWVPENKNDEYNYYKTKILESVNFTEKLTIKDQFTK